MPIFATLLPQTGLLLEQIFPGCTVQMTTIVINPKGTARYNEFLASRNTPSSCLSDLRKTAVNR